MDEPVAKAHDLRPGDLPIPSSLILRDPTGSLADDFEEADEGEIQQAFGSLLDIH